jgi:hypothetical protein
MSAQTRTATVGGRQTRRLGMAVLHPGMKDRQRCAHEFRDFPLRRDATGIEGARELRVAERQELMDVADVLEL